MILTSENQSLWTAKRAKVPAGAYSHFGSLRGLEKARGAYFEVGYAKALKKKVIIIHKKGTEATFLEAAADVSIEYDNLENLKEKLKGKIKYLFIK